MEEVTGNCINDLFFDLFCSQILLGCDSIKGNEMGWGSSTNLEVKRPFGRSRHWQKGIKVDLENTPLIIFRCVCNIANVQLLALS